MAFFKGSSEKANFKIICPENALKAMFSGHFCRAFSNSSSFKSFAQKKPISRLYARRRPGKPSLFRSGQKKESRSSLKKHFSLPHPNMDKAFFCLPAQTWIKPSFVCFAQTGATPLSAPSGIGAKSLSALPQYRRRACTTRSPICRLSLRFRKGL